VVNNTVKINLLAYIEGCKTSLLTGDINCFDGCYYNTRKAEKFTNM